MNRMKNEAVSKAAASGSDALQPGTCSVHACRQNTMQKTCTWETVQNASRESHAKNMK